MTPQTTRVTFLGLTAVFALSLALPLPGTDGRIDHLPSVCPFRQITGLPCPGCGLTRAFVCLSHGHFAESLHWHPIGWLVYGTFLAVWVRAGLTWAFGKPFAPLPAKVLGRFQWTAISVLLLVGVIRIGWTLTHPSLGIP